MRPEFGVDRPKVPARALRRKPLPPGAEEAGDPGAAASQGDDPWAQDPWQPPRLDRAG